MAKKEFDTPNILRSVIGEEVSVTDWIEITQDRINLFADATGDHQWIHIDVERAQRESPYRRTIGHGFLTLSMLSVLMQQSVGFKGGLKYAINYGLNRVRFPAPVPAGTRIRARVKLHSLEDITGGVQATWAITVENEGSEKPVCVAEWVVRYYT
jgi:acyl dehydratase